jgi:hypothetical protein
MLTALHRTKHHALTQKTTRHESYLSRLNSECISKINKININQSTKSAIEEINHKYRLDIYEEVKYQYDLLHSHKIFYPDDTIASRELATGHQISYGLFSTQEFLKNYSVIIPGMSLEAAIHPLHKNYLIKSFQSTLNEISNDERTMLAEVIHPKVFEWLNLEIRPEELQASLKSAQNKTLQLSTDHVLALVDYCSSQSGSFNSANDGMRVWQISGSDTLAKISDCLTRPLNEALDILSLHENFRYEGPAYKGIVLANGAGPYRLARMQPGMNYISPHWLSATSRPESNYASDACCYSSHAISLNRRDTQITVLNTKAVKVHLFNDMSSIDQREIMIPRKPLIFLCPDSIEHSVRALAQSRHTLYCTMAKEDL